MPTDRIMIKPVEPKTRYDPLKAWSASQGALLLSKRLAKMCTVGLVAAFGLAACSPAAPPGVDRDELDAAVSRAIGDPATCVLIGQIGSGRLLYRYNSATACDRELPSCSGPATTRIGEVLKAAARDRQSRTRSCDTTADASRGVGWASGPIAGTHLVYAAMMEGDRAFPGRVMADRLSGAFRRAKVSR